MTGDGSGSLPLWAAFALVIGIGISAAVAFGRAPGRKYVSWCLAGLAPFVTWLAPPEPAIARFLIAMSGMLTLFHVVDLTRDRRNLSARDRVWFTLTPFDTRAIERIRPTFHPRLVLALLAWTALTTTAFWVHETQLPESGPERLLVRWTTGLVGFYSLVEVMGAAMLQGYLLAGMRPPPLHLTPMLARTVQEFWGERWNLEVRRWLHLHAFMPLARRRKPVVGVLAAFFGSTLLHVWLMLPSRGLELAGMWASFFMAQGLIIIVERKLQVAKWRRPFAHVWTKTLLILTSPLFIEPILRVFPG